MKSLFEKETTVMPERNSDRDSNLMFHDGLELDYDPNEEDEDEDEELFSEN